MADVSVVKSIWGRVLGLDENYDLVLNGRRLTNFGASSAVSLGAPNGATVVATQQGNGIVNKTILTCTATPISVADDAGQSQYGGVKVYDFPEGLIILYGAIVSGTLTMGLTGTIIDAFTGVLALGSAVATASGAPTLVTTTAVWMQSSTISAATAKVATIDAVSAATQLTESGARHVDGTAVSGGLDMYLNFKIADDVTHTAATGTFTGTIKFLWTLLGDN